MPYTLRVTSAWTLVRTVRLSQGAQEVRKLCIDCSTGRWVVSIRVSILSTGEAATAPPPGQLLMTTAGRANGESALLIGRTRTPCP